MGRTYRYFIWDGVSIFVNGQAVKVIDPLYARTEGTRFPKDPKAEEYDEIVIPWRVDAFDTPKDAPDESNIIIKLSLLPEELRPKLGSGGWSSNNDRFIYMNEGISILRNKREVFYGLIPYWKSAGEGWPQFENIDRWWGCEIHFDAVLDRAFTVKNIKRGALPNKLLKEAIKGQIQATRETCLKKVRDLWKKNSLKDRERNAKNKEVQRAGDHERAEAIAKKTPLETSEIDKDKQIEIETKEFMKKKGERYNAEQQIAIENLFNTQPFTILEDTWRGQQFFETKHLGGSSILEYNMSHIFFEKIFEIIGSLEEIESREEAVKVARSLKDLIDILIIAYAKGEARFAPDQKMEAEDFIQNIRVNWGQFLQSY